MKGDLAPVAKVMIKFSVQNLLQERANDPHWSRTRMSPEGPGTRGKSQEHLRLLTSSEEEESKTGVTCLQRSNAVNFS
ncbi:hypothetical protein NPIL_140301, partial [Nephila pilipes]